MANDDVRNVETILDVADMANRLARRMGKEMILNDRWRDQVDRHLEMDRTIRVESR
jgi:hypothetical protein